MTPPTPISTGQPTKGRQAPGQALNDAITSSHHYLITPSSNIVRPRALAHRGVVEAAGLLFHVDLLPDEEAHRRVLALWSNGTTVYQTSAGLLVLFPAPIRTRSEQVTGTPVVRAGGLLLTAPLAQTELEQLLAPEGSLIFCRDGVALAIPFGEQDRQDPAEWLDVSGWSAMDAASLGVPPAPPVLVTQPPDFSARERLAGLAPPTAQHSAAVEALRRALTGGVPADADGPGLRGVAGRALRGLAGMLKSLGTGGGSGGAGRPLQGKGLAVAPAASTRPGASLLDQLADRMNDVAARLLLASGMASLIGRKQAEYMDRMMRMFEAGMLDEALRHAIGLSDVESLDHRPPLLRTPTPRADLTISAEKLPARASLSTDGELFGQLRAMYRKAFEKLSEEGRIDEAAFVLAELLNSHEEAVAFLEKHDRLKLAAEMAEARGLAPGLVVRLWFLAGDRERAARLAWKSGAFADAVDRMQRIDPARAREMRLFWAAELVRAGAYAAAVDALWPDRELREQTLLWIESAIAIGGPVGGRMLAYKMALVGGKEEALLQVVIGLLRDENPETAADRRAFVTELAILEAGGITPPIYRLAARTVLRDAGSGCYALGKNQFDRIVKQAEDGALRTDLPRLPSLPVRDLRTLPEPVSLIITGADVGAAPIRDAVLLPGGRTVLALGEAGVRLITSDGRTVVQWDIPAERLVVSDQGDRVIALIRRGDLWQMSRIDLITRRAEPWRDAALQAIAPDFDGALWFAAIDNALIAIDASAPGLEALWREPNIDGRAVAINRSATHCSLLLLQTVAKNEWGNPMLPQASMERRTYALPSIVLRDRTMLAAPAANGGAPIAAAMSITPEGQTIYVSADHVGRAAAAGGYRGQLLVASDPTKGTLYEELISEPSEPLPAALNESWAVLSTRSASGVCCRILDRASWRVRARFTRERATAVVSRFHGSRATFADDLGRLIALDLESGRILRNLRVR